TTPRPQPPAERRRGGGRRVETRRWWSRGRSAPVWPRRCGGGRLAERRRGGGRLAVRGACHPGPVTTVYDAAGGLDGLLRLAAAWHRRVIADEVVGHAFSHGYRTDHTERLAAYWAEALGGPRLYTGVFGDETAV